MAVCGIGIFVEQIFLITQKLGNEVLLSHYATMMQVTSCPKDRLAIVSIFYPTRGASLFSTQEEVLWE